MRTALSIFFLLCVIAPSLGQSVLASGQWHKIGVTKSGIYKIDRAYLKNELGIDVNSLNPKTFKIYGSEFKGMLPQSNQISRAFDPVEYAIYASGQEDGTMDDNDYFLFYANGPDHFSLDAEGLVNYEKNIYSDTSYMLVTYGGHEGKRLKTLEKGQVSGTPVTSYTDFIVHEEDETNFIQSGRRWFSSRFSSGSLTNQRFTYQKPGAKGPVEVHLTAVAESDDPCSFDVILNNTVIGNVPISAVTNGTYNNKGKEAAGVASSVISSHEINLELRFNPGAARSYGYIDYFIVSLERELAVYENETIFHLPVSLESTVYEIRNADDRSMLWEVTSIGDVSLQSFDLVNDRIQFGPANTAGGSYVVFTGNDFPAPAYFHKIPKQDIKSFAGNEGMIITHPDFLSEARRLADFHRRHSGLTVGVVTTRQVYNEFSSGTQDISAIRDYLKYCYDSGNLKYALLFGDGSYDYKNRRNHNTNFVPVYESRESFHPIFSYSSDDYFAFLEDDEGYWDEGAQYGGESYTISGYVDHTLEIGIGRLPVKNRAEAEKVVDKLVRYKTSDRTFGKWRNNIAYLADDGDGGEHMQQTEELFASVDTQYLEYNATKLHLDAFEQEINPSNERSPKTQEALLKVLEDGVFILNYLGHGGEFQLAEENIVTTDFIDQLKNRQRLPLVVTATCDFGKYDNPSMVSGAEKLILHEHGGAIALLTTTRPVFAKTNFLVNNAFHASVFQKINGEWPRLGDVQRATKNESLGRGPVNRNFALLGDPMLRLNYPNYQITFDQLEGEKDTLSALENYHLSGKIANAQGTVSSFNGNGTISLWDIPQQKVTKGQENPPFHYEDQTNVLFRGEVSVREGRFELSFILPKNTSYKYLPGKLTMYAWNEKEFIDASGASRNFVLGGTADQITPDNSPPTIKLFLNDSSFSPGNTVGSSSLFIADLSDQSGINISNNGFNQSITLTLNDGDAIELNEFYTAYKDDFTRGTILYPLRNLEPGRYSATLKVWDTHNNSSTSTVEFKVSDQPILNLYNAKLYPNPVESHAEATFSFEHDREGEELLVNVSIYNMMGREVSSWSQSIDNSPRKIDNIRWRVSNFQGGQLEKGIYIYRFSVSSTQDNAYNEVIKRLVIIN